MTTSPQPTSEAIEAATEVLATAWQNSDEERAPWEYEVRAALTAALPAIRAEVLAEVAEAIEGEAHRTLHDGEPFPSADLRDQYLDAMDDAVDTVRALANPTPAAKETGK